MLRRIVLTATASAAALASFAGAPAASALPLLPVPLPPLLDWEAPEDRLTVVVSETGNTRTDGRYELECGPTAGNHPAAEAACDRLDELARAGGDPFAPVDRDVFCTQQAGGPATAYVTGVWQGRRVDATFSRQNGCEIHRWNNLQPVLPSAGA
ncbi:SSI family serine proteinase inhibitor [Streptomyces sp. NPDC058953]|uniref:SSI family serine proteinase inhibitor n=1 Tax=unclassified Streptomyces TaxID=2593676 RepID=UPI0036845F9E